MPKKKTFRKYSYRGVDLENLLVMPMAELMDLVHARARRRFKHGLKRKYYSLLKRLRAAKKACNTVEIKADMVAHYLGEFSLTYKPVKHGTAGIGATKSSRFVPLK